MQRGCPNPKRGPKFWCSQSSAKRVKPPKEFSSESSYSGDPAGIPKPAPEPPRRRNRAHGQGQTKKQKKYRGIREEAKTEASTTEPVTRPTSHLQLWNLPTTEATTICSLQWSQARCTDRSSSSQSFREECGCSSDALAFHGEPSAKRRGPIRLPHSYHSFFLFLFTEFCLVRIRRHTHTESALHTLQWGSWFPRCCLVTLLLSGGRTWNAAACM